jgi:hypothetical protein
MSEMDSGKVENQSFWQKLWKKLYFWKKPKASEEKEENENTVIEKNGDTDSDSTKKTESKEGVVELKSSSRPVSYFIQKSLAADDDSGLSSDDDVEL